MLDLRMIRERSDEVRRRLAPKDPNADVYAVLELDTRRRGLLAEAESLKHDRNVASKALGELKKQGGEISEKQHELRELGERIKDLDRELRQVDERLHEGLLSIPNLPHESAPVGDPPEGNRTVRIVGEPRAFDFPPRPHWEIGESLGIFDFGRASRLAGAGFPLLMGMGARLQRALVQFMLDLHVNEHGYREVAVPFLVNEAAMTGTGQLPKLENEMYRIESDGLYLIPTAEVPITNIYREEVLVESLPINLTGHSPCFRREAGAAGRDTRGMIRVHQFEKVEMVKFVEPDRSYEELENLLRDAEDVLKRLDLHYRVVELCAGDLSFAAAKCYDLELWAPAEERWLEISSCSNFEDFQARRAGIRYRPAGGKPEFVHTLNGSGVALPRLIVAILENGQEEDGSVTLPEAIHPYLGGATRISVSR